MHRIMISALLHMLKAASGDVETTAFGLFQLVLEGTDLRAGAIAKDRPGAQGRGVVALRLRHCTLKRQGLCRFHLCVNMPGPGCAFLLPSPS
jgi:hypothetical protein